MGEFGYGHLEDVPGYEDSDLLLQDGQSGQCESVALVFGDIAANIDVDSETFTCQNVGSTWATAYIAFANPTAKPEAYIDDDADEDVDEEVADDARTVTE